jgi:biopolymer transport protein ExbD
MRKSKYKLPKANTTFALNINSMTDMFTIMLVFLLQTYSTNAFELKQQKDIKVPESTAEKNIDEALEMSLSSTVLKVKNQDIAKLKDGVFTTENLDSEDAEIIKPLLAELKIKAQEIEKSTVIEKKTGQIILLADRSLPYSTLKKVLYTASAAGFPKLKLATTAGSN